MVPYAVTIGDVKYEHMVLLERLRELVAAMPDGFTCHQVCERAAEQLGLAHVRGTYNGFDHSWLVHERDRLIYDAYPWACASGPILLVRSMVHDNLYAEARDEEAGT